MNKKGRRQRRGTGGIRYKNGKIEGTYILYRKDCTCIKKSFTRDTEAEINDIKARLRLLGTLDNDVEDIDINRYTNEIKIIKKMGENSNTKLHSDILVKDYVDYYLFEHRKNGLNGRKIEDTTFASYIDRGKSIKKYIGDKQIAKLTLRDIEDFINNLHRDTCDTTARQTRDIIVNMMKFAQKDGVTEQNVLQNENINLKERKGKNEKKIIQKEDLTKFIEYCKSNKYYDLLLILVTGIRASELAGLTWNNLNMENKTLTIEKEYMRVKKQEYKDGKIITKRVKEFKDLKTKNSYRTIGVRDKMIDLLKQHKEEQKVLAEKCGIEFKETDFIFTTKNYKGYVADYISDKFRKVMNELKIEAYEELTTHCLRHTFCTLGIENGVRLEEMKNILGHANVAVTGDWYTHLDKQATINASNKVTKYMEAYF